MTEQTTTPVAETAEKDELIRRFPDYIKRDERDGYEGYIVDRAHLVEVATALRDEMGYDFLGSLTGVDYLPDGYLEAVYHVFQSTGGPGLVFKAQTPREDPVIPSLVPVYPGRADAPPFLKAAVI